MLVLTILKPWGASETVYVQGPEFHVTPLSRGRGLDFTVVLSLCLIKLSLKVKTNRHIFHQTYESMCTPLESGDLPTVVVNPEASFEPVRDAVLDIRDRVEDLCNQELGKITKQGLSQESYLVLSSLCLLVSYLWLILLSVSFQSTTQRCSLWETVSSKHVSFQHNKLTSVESSCLITMTSSYVIQPTGTQDRKEGFLNVSF